VIDFEVHAEDAGQRLDRYLRKLLPAAPLALIYRWIRQKKLRLNGKRTQQGVRLEEGDRLTIAIAEQRVQELRGSGEASGSSGPRSAEAALPELRVVFEDADLLAVDKPAGLPVQPGSGHERLHLTAMVAARHPSPEAALFRPAAAHRLDLETTGLVLFGLSGQGLRGLTEAFREGKVEKRYLAIVAGIVEKQRDRIEMPLARVDAKDGPKMRVRAEGAKNAVTEYERLASGRASSLLELRLETGRLHQIRAHLAEIGHPVLGDPRYGERRCPPGLPKRRILLHAARLRLPHPTQAETLELEARPDSVFRRFEKALREGSDR